MIITIDPESPVPKYKQIINTVSQAVKNGILKQDEQLPSINEMSESNYLARDTVEKAYNELKERGVIKSVRGKGYFAQSSASNKIKVMLIMNKMSSYKKDYLLRFSESTRRCGSCRSFYTSLQCFDIQGSAGREPGKIQLHCDHASFL